MTYKLDPNSFKGSDGQIYELNPTAFQDKNGSIWMAAHSALIEDSKIYTHAHESKMLEYKDAIYKELIILDVSAVPH